MSRTTLGLRAVCVFCGSSPGLAPRFGEAARRLGAELARRGSTLVFGGGGTGLMGLAADGVIAGGGQAVGVIPKSMVDAGLEHRGGAELRVVRSMHERKALMGRLASAFLCLPGGLGTFEELLETMTWAQLGIHRKPMGLLNLDGYYDPLLALFERAAAEGFLKRTEIQRLAVDPDPAKLLDKLEQYQPPPLPEPHLEWEEI